MKVTRSSGNVFADLGLPNAEERLLKAQLASQIARIIDRRDLTQSAAASLMGIDQPKVSNLLHGRLAGFSSDRLFTWLTALGQDVEILVTTPARQRHGHIHVRMVADAAGHSPSQVHVGASKSILRSNKRAAKQLKRKKAVA